LIGLEICLWSQKKKEVEIVLKESLYDKNCKPTIGDVLEVFPDVNNGIGISALLSVIELAVDDDNCITPDNFQTSLQARAKNLDFFIGNKPDILNSNLIPKNQKEEDEEEPNQAFS